MSEDSKSNDSKSNDSKSNKQNKTLLITGGSGYIGSHTVLELICNGYNCAVIDSLVNSSRESLDRVQQLARELQAENGGSQNLGKIDFFQLDLCDEKGLEAFFASAPQFEACIHFAGLKAVGESVAKPLYYYRNNLSGTLNLLQLLEKYKCTNLVFSSSATVYGEPSADPSKIEETYLLRATNPYGRTKLFIEDILRDVAIGSPGKWKICILRYFNPVGNHTSGLIGEDPNGAPNNLFPFILQVAVGRREYLTVFGDKYDTVDGTGVRDYIHVVDLAKGHVAALVTGIFGGGMKQDCDVYNLGSGKGTSVLESVSLMEKASGKKISYKIGAARPGDVAKVVCLPTKAEKELKWKAQLTMEDAARDGWKWQSINPHGYNTNKEEEHKK